MTEKSSFGRRTWDREEYARLAAERNQNKTAQSVTAKKNAVSRDQLNFETDLNKRQVVTGQVGGMRGEGLGFRCTLCDLRFKDNLKFVDHLNSPQHLMNSGEKRVEPATLEQVKLKFEELVKKKHLSQTSKDEDYDIKLKIQEHKESRQELIAKRQKKNTSPEPQAHDPMAQMMGFSGFGSTKK